LKIHLKRIQIDANLKSGIFTWKEADAL